MKDFFDADRSRKTPVPTHVTAFVWHEPGLMPERCWIGVALVPHIVKVTASSDADAQGAIRARVDQIRDEVGSVDPSLAPAITWVFRKPEPIEIGLFA